MIVLELADKTAYDIVVYFLMLIIHAGKEREMEKQIQFEDVTVFYDTYNDKEKKTVVLIHGFGLDGEMWESQLKSLNEYKVINIDARGHGRSQPCEQFTVVDVCHDIAAILDQEKCKAAALIGLSMGSYVVQEFVRLYPKRTLGILAADGTPLYIKYPRWEGAALQWSLPMLKLYSWDGLKRAMVKQVSVNKEVRKTLMRLFDKQTKETFIRSWSTFVYVLHEEIFKPECPVYVAYGESDRSGTIKMHAKDWVEAYPGCTVFEIPDAGHVSNMDNPNAFNKIMHQFFEAVW